MSIVYEPCTQISDLGVLLLILFGMFVGAVLTTILVGEFT